MLEYTVWTAVTTLIVVLFLAGSWAGSRSTLFRSLLVAIALLVGFAPTSARAMQDSAEANTQEVEVAAEEAAPEAAAADESGAETAETVAPAETTPAADGGSKGGMPWIAYLIPLLGVAGLCFTYWKTKWVSKRTFTNINK